MPFFLIKKKWQSPQKNKNPKDGLFAMYWPLRVNQIIVFNFQHAALVSDMQSIPKNTQFLTIMVFDFRIFEIRIFSSI